MIEPLTRDQAFLPASPAPGSGPRSEFSTIFSGIGSAPVTELHRKLVGLIVGEVSGDSNPGRPGLHR